MILPFPPGKAQGEGASQTMNESNDSTSNDPAIDPALLKSAYNAFKKRWKLTRLDYESRIGRGPLSSGSKSAIVGIAAPKEFPRRSGKSS